MGHHHADDAGTLALDANRVVRHIGPASSEECGNYFHKLMFVNRAATQLEIDGDVPESASRWPSLDVLGLGIDDLRYS